MNRGMTAFDVVVVGAGPAGIAAATVAAEKGLRVAVLDASPWVGGQIWHGEQAGLESRQARRWLDRLRESGARVMLGTPVVAAPGPGVVLAESGGRPLEVGWQSLILATGARELLLPFPGWTLPNVMGAGGLQALVKAGWPVAGKRVVVAGSGPLLFSVAAHLRQAGARVLLVAEQTSWAGLLGFGLRLPVLAPGKLIQAAQYQMRLLGVRYRPGCWPVSAQGHGQVEGVTLSTGAKTWTVPCDVLACGFNLVPNLELASLLGCQIADDKVRVDLWQQTSVVNVFCAGEPTGLGGVDRALIEGQIAGLAVSGQQEQARRLFAARSRAQRFSQTLERGFALREEVRHLAEPGTIVCRCEDVTLRQLEAHGDWRTAKLHTRCGMGSCQGRTCGSAAKVLFGWQRPSVRPPVFPTSLAALAGVEGTAQVSRQESTDNSQESGVRRQETGGRLRKAPLPHGY
jgi:NADPH-dependent 2,4-dienoyl-CoA reductase/sulfur reductase-like enzyme